MLKYIEPDIGNLSVYSGLVLVTQQIDLHQTIQFNVHDNTLENVVCYLSGELKRKQH